MSIDDPTLFQMLKQDLRPALHSQDATVYWGCSYRVPVIEFFGAGSLDAFWDSLHMTVTVSTICCLEHPFPEDVIPQAAQLNTYQKNGILFPSQQVQRLQIFPWNYPFWLVPPGQYWAEAAHSQRIPGPAAMSGAKVSRIALVVDPKTSAEWNLLGFWRREIQWLLSLKPIWPYRNFSDWIFLCTALLQ